MTMIETGRSVDGWGFGHAVATGAVQGQNKAGSHGRAGRGRDLPTVGDFVVPAPVRLAHRIAGAAMVRDVAALGAVILFATMVAVLLGLGEPGV